MNHKIFESADTIGKFCRLYINSKRDLPIRASEMGVLIYIYNSKFNVTPMSISEFFTMAKPSVTSITKSLIKKGYLEKSKSTKDKRSYFLLSTSKAEALLSQTLPEYMGLIESIEDKLGKEKFKEFIKMMEIANGVLEGRF